MESIISLLTGFGWTFMIVGHIGLFAMVAMGLFIYFNR